MSINTVELMGNVVMLKNKIVVFREKVCAATVALNSHVFWRKYEMSEVRHSLDDMLVQIEATTSAVVMQQKWDLVNYYEFSLYMTYKKPSIDKDIALLKIVPFRPIMRKTERCPSHGHTFKLNLPPESEIYLIGTGSFVRIMRKQNGYFVGRFQPINNLERTLREQIINTPIGFKDPSI